MNQDTTLRRLHARVIVRRRAQDAEFLLNEHDFRFAADCERMRVDRNGSVLSLLLIKLAKGRDPSEVRLIARVLEGRLRTTDTPALLNDGRIAVLLPDTSAEGAWKVAADVSEVFPPGPERPQCDVLVYPPKHEGDESLGLRDEESAPEGATESFDEQASSEFFFSRAMPWWKRGLDVVGALAGMAITAPAIAAAAVAIKATSHGPVFFSQEREGLGGRPFQIWKLRSMRIDAEDHKPSLLELSEQDGPAFKMRRDPRTTTVGRFLRWSSVDELPQFWNVLRGEMSLVGPRPLPTHESKACQPWQRRRLAVMPGMTCIWQVRARGNVRFDDWVRMDLEYVARPTLLHDLKLLALTLPSLLFHRGMR